jgi:hypothetical protein
VKTTARERLIIGLSIHEIVGTINRTMKDHKLVFKLSYQDKHRPAFLVRRNGGPFETVMLADPRAHTFWSVAIFDPTTAQIMRELNEQLRQESAELRLTCAKNRDGSKRTMLQIYVDGSKHTALTIMETRRGGHILDSDFELPGESSDPQHN